MRQALGVKSDEYGFSNYSLLTMNLLYLSHKKLFLNCFRTKDMRFDEVLFKNKNGEYNIFGINYLKTTIESLK